MPLVASRSNASAKAFGWSSAPSAETLGGMVLMTPTSIASTGTGNSSSIGANGSVTFSSCITLSLNGVFTSEYDNYVLGLRWSANSADNWYIRFRASGTDNSTASSYVSQIIDADGTTTTALRTTQNYGRFVYNGATQRAGATAYFYGPNLAQPTAWRTNHVSDYLSAYIFDVAGTHNQSTAYDGLTIYSSGGYAFSGLVSVYGLGG